MSIDQSSFAAWLRAHARARQRPDAALLGGLFTDDALYLATPDAEPLIGRTAIVARWAQLAPPIEPAAFRFEVLAVTESSAIAWWRAPHRSPSAHDRPGSFEAQASRCARSPPTVAAACSWTGRSGGPGSELPGWRRSVSSGPPGRAGSADCANEYVALLRRRPMSAGG